MAILKDIIQEAQKEKKAIGHFNVSDLTCLKAIFEAAYPLNLPVIIGVSEGERSFVGVNQIAALVRGLREESASGGNHPIFLNADHTKSLAGIKQAVEAGFDAVMFDASRLPLEENIAQTKQVVEYIKSTNSKILIEAELGSIKGTSTILSTSDVNNIREEDLTKPEEAKKFVKETKIDLLAPAVGNIHGIISRTRTDLTQSYLPAIGLRRRRWQAGAENPPLDIKRIAEIKKAVDIPLVLHGGSGISDGDLLAAIEAGISVVHINTELRLAWRLGIEKSLKEKPEEIAPYKLLSAAVEEIKKVVEKKLKLFNKII